MIVGLPDGQKHEFTPRLNVVIIRYRDSRWQFMNHVEHACVPDCPNENEGILFIFGNVYEKLSQYLIRHGHDLVIAQSPLEDEFTAYEHIMGINPRNGPPLSEKDLDSFVKGIQENGNIWNELNQMGHYGEDDVV